MQRRRRLRDSPTPAPDFEGGVAMRPLNRVCVIGAGAWGTALAGVAARAGREVTLYARDAAVAATISATRDNPRLPGIPLDPGIAVTDDVAAAAGRAEVVVIAVPAQN